MAEDTQTFGCATCGREFLVFEEAAAHVNICNETSLVASYSCPCGREFLDTEEADNHIATCAASSPTEARPCGNPDESTDASSNAVKMALLDIMEPKYDAYKAMNPNQRKKFWETVSGQLNITKDDARGIWNSLITSYKRRKMNKTRTGRGKVKEWVFEDIIDRIVKDDPAIQAPSFVLASMPTSRASQGSTAATTSNETSAASTSQTMRTDDIEDEESPGTSPSTSTQAPNETPVTSSKRKARRPQRDSLVTELLSKMDQKESWMKSYFSKKEKREEKRIQLEELKLRVLENLANRLSGTSGQ